MSTLPLGSVSTYDAARQRSRRPWTLRLVTAPASEPVTLQEAKDALFYTEDAQNSHITRLIKAARIAVETITHRALFTQTFDLFMDDFPQVCRATPDAEIEVPRPPLASVTYLKYYDSDGTLQTLTASTDYRVDADATPGRVQPAFGTSWPSVRTISSAVQMRFICGDSAVASIPENAKVAILEFVDLWFNFRAPVVIGFRSISQVPDSVMRLLSDLIVPRVV